MKYSILGPLELTDGEAALRMRGAKPRQLLALLLIRANEVVSTDRIIEELWPRDRPADAPGTVQSYVSVLRRFLDARGGPPQRLVTRRPGYMLKVRADELDAMQFGELVARGYRLLGENTPVAAAALREALALWRGPALAEFAEMECARAEVARLEELRLVATEGRIEADLMLGQHAEVVAELQALVGEHPLRERLREQLMLALYRSGRQADALQAYQDVRGKLKENLGIDPSPALARLEHQILWHDPELDWSPPAVEEEEPQGPKIDATALPTGEVTFMLTDIERSSELWDRDANAMSSALARHEEIVTRLVQSHDGHLIRTRGEGDSTFSVFLSANDALATAIGLQSALVAESWSTELPLSTRVALQTGSAELRDGNYFGSAVNLAARLRGLARGGQVLLSRVTADLVRDTLPPGALLVDMGSQRLRGFRRPESVFGLVHPDFAVEYPPLEMARSPSILNVCTSTSSLDGGDFVGRSTPFQVLQQNWGQVLAAHRRQLVLLSGEAGIGKTRLAAEFGRAAHEAGAVVLYGRSDPEFVGSYQPFAMALRDYAASRSWSDLRAAVGSHGALLSRVVPELGDDLADTAETGVDRFRLFEAVSEMLLQIARQSPVVVILDDLQWADQPTVLLLQHLMRDTEPAEIFVLGTYRSEDVDPAHPLAEALRRLHSDGVATRIDLSGLAVDDVASLLREHAPEEILSQTLAASATVRDITAGNPLFIKQVIYHLAESATDLRDSTSLHLLAPEGVRELVAQRLARLSPSAATALRIASVIGQTFDFGLLAAVSDTDEERLLEAVDEVLASRLVEEQPEGSDRFVFSHAVVRNVIYSGLTAARRMRFHRRVAEALEKVTAHDATGRIMELSHHFLEAAPTGVSDKAAQYTIAAGRAALDSLAFEDAASLGRRGLAVLDDADASEPPVPSEERCDLLLLVGQAERLAGQRVGRVTLLRAFDIARSLGDPQRMADAVLAENRGFFARIGRTDQELVEALQTAIDAQPPGDSPVTADLLATYASELVWTEDGERRFELSNRALAMARRLGDARTLARVLLLRNLTISAPDTLMERIAECHELLRIADELRDPGIRFQAAFHRSGTALESGDVQGARQMVGLAGGLATELRQPSLLWQASFMRTARNILEGGLEEAEQTARESLELGREANQDAEAFIFFTEQMLEIRRWQGRLAEMLPDFRAAAGVDGIDFGYSLVRYLFDAGERQAASCCYAEIAGRLVLPPRRDMLAMTTLANLAYLAANFGDVEHASSIYEALAPFADAFPTTTVARAVGAHHLAMLAAVTGQIELAGHHFETAARIHQDVGAPLLHAETHIEWARMLFEQGRSDGQTARILEAARATAGRHGALYLERRCEELSGQLEE